MSEEFVFISKKYQIQKFISKGSIGKVYLAREINLETILPLNPHEISIEQQVIIKIIKKDENKTKDRIRRESEIPNLLSHPNIIKILDFIENETHAYFVYPYMINSFSLSKINKSDLIFNKSNKIKTLIEMEYLSNIKGSYPNDNNLRHIVNVMYQIADAIEYMHSKFIIHGDIKPQNIIISDDKAILIDFDLSSIINHPFYPIKKGIFGTPNYLAPEIWKQEKNILYELTDIYSFGITLYYVFNRKKLPYKPKSIEDMEYMIRNIKPFPSKTGIIFLDKLIMLAISKDPKMRPSISEIKSFLKTYLLML